MRIEVYHDETIYFARSLTPGNRYPYTGQGQTIDEAIGQFVRVMQGINGTLNITEIELNCPDLSLAEMISRDRRHHINYNREPSSSEYDDEDEENSTSTEDEEELSSESSEFSESSEDDIPSSIPSLTPRFSQSSSSSEEDNRIGGSAGRHILGLRVSSDNSSLPEVVWENSIYVPWNRNTLPKDRLLWVRCAKPDLSDLSIAVSSTISWDETDFLVQGCDEECVYVLAPTTNNRLYYLAITYLAFLNRFRTLNNEPCGMQNSTYHASTQPLDDLEIE